MCDACLDGYLDGETLTEPTAEQIAAAGIIAWVYEQNWGIVGGPLHVIADDHNLDDEYFEDPVLIHEPWQEALYRDVPDRGKERCERVYALLKPMSPAQRAQVMRLVEEIRGR